MKKQSARERYIGYWSLCYCVVMLLCFPLFFHNSYIDILEAKTGFFYVITGIYLIGIVGGSIFLLIHQKKKEGTQKKRIKIIKWSPTDYFAVLFVIASLVSMLMADYKENVFWGIEGKLFGVFALLLCCGIYMALSHYFQWNTIFFWSCLFGVGSVSVLSVCNRFGMDPLCMYDKIDSTQIKDYISTIGQINIVSNYLCIFVPLLMGLFFFTKTKTSKILYGSGTILGIMAGVCTNSDSFFLGMLMAYFYFWYFAFDSKEKLCDFVLLGSMGTGALWMLNILNGWCQYPIECRNLQMILVSYVPSVFWLICLLIFVFLWIGIKKKMPDRMEGALKKGRRILFSLLGVVFLAGIGVIIYGNMTGGTIFPSFIREYFIFDDTWGTNRGYVWKRTVKLFGELPLFQKLFGVGPGNFELFFEEYFINSMASFGYYFQDAHNEFLQFLVTTGIVGAIGYFGMLITSVLNCMKEKETIKKVFAIVFLVWIVQGMVNNPIVFTTPYLFLFMGINQIPWEEKD